MVINLPIKKSSKGLKILNISRTSFDRDKSFPINGVYRIQIKKE